jgi:hypothetical protein
MKSNALDQCAPIENKLDSPPSQTPETEALAIDEHGNPTDIEKMKLVYVSPEKLTFHPALTRVPRGTAREMELLRQDAKDRKRIVQPVLADLQLRVYDGRQRTEVARELKFERIPVFIEACDDPIDIALSSCIARRNLSKAGIALTLFEAYPEPADSRSNRGRQHQLAKIRGHVSEKTISEIYDLPSYKTLSAKYGIPAQYFTYLAAIWDSCEDTNDDTEWSAIKTKLLTGEVKLEAVLRGRAREASNKGRKTQRCSALCGDRANPHQESAPRVKALG